MIIKVHEQPWKKKTIYPVDIKVIFHKQKGRFFPVSLFLLETNNCFFFCLFCFVFFFLGNEYRDLAIFFFFAFNWNATISPLQIKKNITENESIATSFER